MIGRDPAMPRREAVLQEARTDGDRWLVLLVDDEPEVHDITQLVLADLSFSGFPVELRSAYSAAEAREFLETHPDTAMMLLDVVMETDDAGLRLVRYVREQLANRDLQIVVRTGQPGMAPEQEVIGAYEINGYFLKTEMVAHRLRSIVISSLRAYSHIRALRPAGNPSTVPDVDVSRGLQQLALEDGLARALEEDSLLLLAQPQMHLASGTLAGIELIPQWKRGDTILGFAQLTESVRDDDLRLQFDDWFVRKACGWHHSWQKAGLLPFRTSISTLTNPLADSRIVSLLERYLADVPTGRGTLDLAVAVALVRTNAVAERDALTRMRAMGVSITLLDFGLGAVSLSQLSRLMPDRVRIHQSFVRRVAQDRSRSSIARSLIALAHTLGLSVIAEGILREDDLQFFKWEGCDIGQGDLVARPMAVGDVVSAMRAGSPSAFLRNDLH